MNLRFNKSNPNEREEEEEGDRKMRSELVSKEKEEKEANVKASPKEVPFQLLDLFAGGKEYSLKFL